MGTVAAEVKTGLAGEGSHWYAKDGTAVYEVPRADGKGYRPATLRDARKLGLLPGLTSVIKVMAAPGLERWKQENLLLAAATLPKQDGEEVEQWMQRVREDAWAQGEKARETGTAIHKIIELLLQGNYVQGELTRFAMPALDWITQRFQGQDWLVERGFANRIGYGCRIDFGTVGKRLALVDFKTTDKPLDDVKAWPEHTIQLAGQAMAVFHDKARDPLEVECINLFVSTREPGVKAIVHPVADIAVGWQKLKRLVELWQLDKQYFPGGPICS